MPHAAYSSGVNTVVGIRCASIASTESLNSLLASSLPDLMAAALTAASASIECNNISDIAATECVRTEEPCCDRELNRVSAGRVTRTAQSADAVQVQAYIQLVLPGEPYYY
jgi:hypothetical protein